MRAASMHAAIFEAETRAGGKRAGGAVEEPGAKRAKTDGHSADTSMCPICQSAPRELVLEPCSHLCVCRGCLPLLPKKCCPICRAPFTSTKRVFL